MVFDLDPDEGTGFCRVLLDLCVPLAGLGSWPLLSDGKGVHVAVPLRRTASWHTVKRSAAG